MFLRAIRLPTFSLVVPELKDAARAGKLLATNPKATRIAYATDCGQCALGYFMEEEDRDWLIKHPEINGLPMNALEDYGVKLVCDPIDRRKWQALQNEHDIAFERGAPNRFLDYVEAL